MSRFRQRGDSKLLFFCLAFLIIGIAIRVSLIYLRRHPTGDEIWVYYLVQSSYLDIWLASFSDLHAPFYFLFLHTLGTVFHLDLSILNIRLISLFFGILGNLAIGYVAWKVFGKGTGITAFFLSLALPAFIWPAIFARYYSFLMLLSIFATFTFINFLKSNKEKHLYLFTIISTMGVYTHYYFILLVFSFGLFLMIDREKRKFVKKWALSLFFTSLFFLPALYFLMTLPKPGLAGRHFNDFVKIPAILITNLSSWELLLYLYGNASRLFLIAFIVIFSLVGVKLIVNSVKNSKKSIKYLFLSSIITPPLCAIFFAYSLKPVLSLSSLQIFSPQLIILTALGLVGNKKRVNINSLAFLFLVFTSLILFIRSSYTFNAAQKDIEVILRDFQKGDIVLHSHIYSYIVGRYYLGEGVNFGIVPAFSATKQAEKVLGYRLITEEELLNHSGRVFNVSPPYDTRKELEKIKSILDRRFHMVKMEVFEQGFDRSSFDVYLYQRKMTNI